MQFEPVSFFRSVASSLSLLGHTVDNPAFFRISGVAGLEELLQNLGNAKLPALMLEDEYDGQYEDSGADYISDVRNFMFYVIGQAKAQDMDSRDQVLNECDIIRRQIVAYMIKKHRRDRMIGLDQTGLRNLIKGSFSYFTVGPLIDNFYGIAVGFQIASSSQLSLDLDLWTFESGTENLPGYGDTSS